ncbi:hypothetical protein [Nocardia sp. NPDC051833]|uniref:hypothetical protein n=1 Tax=Nocardia sp. NPDC051833 TaxID=3155674 RepID=UPI00341AE6DE
MPIEGLESAQLKLEHAGRHLDSLTTTVQDYALAGALKITTSWTQNHPDYTLVGILTDPIPVPKLIALQAADVVGNLRAALDHSIFDHVVKKAISTGKPLTDDEQKRIQFPILEKPKKIDAGLYSPAVAQVLESHQPNKMSPTYEHPLARLNRLVNHDKHRVALVTTGADLITDLFYTHPLEHVGSKDIAIGDELKPGVEMFRADFRAIAPLTDHPQKYIKGFSGGFYASIEIPGTTQIPAILATMQSMRDYVKTVLDDLDAAGVT